MKKFLLSIVAVVTLLFASPQKADAFGWYGCQVDEDLYCYAYITQDSVMYIYVDSYGDYIGSCGCAGGKVWCDDTWY